jgi:hypothetical protein
LTRVKEVNKEIIVHPSDVARNLCAGFAKKRKKLENIKENFKKHLQKQKKRGIMVS